MVTKRPCTIYQYCSDIITLSGDVQGDGTQGGFTIKNYKAGDHYDYKKTMNNINY